MDVNEGEDVDEGVDEDEGEAEHAAAAWVVAYPVPESTDPPTE